MTKVEKKVKLKKLKLKKKKKAPKKRRVINNNKNKNVQKINIKVGGQPAQQQRATPFPVVMRNQTPNIDTNAINNLVSELKELRMQSKINKPMRNSFATPDIEHDQHGTFGTESPFSRFGLSPMEDLNGALKDEDYDSEQTINKNPIHVEANKMVEAKPVKTKVRSSKIKLDITKDELLKNLEESNKKLREYEREKNKIQNSNESERLKNKKIASVDKSIAVTTSILKKQELEYKTLMHKGHLETDKDLHDLVNSKE